MKRIIVGIAIFLVVAQLVPYGRDHTNPPITAEPKWDSGQTLEVAARACFDCHSNETIWPWYSNVAPVSWLTQLDTNEGRSKLNFSEWDRPQEEAQKAVKDVRQGSMPPPYYVPVHSAASLSDSEREAFAQGLEKTLAVQGSQGTPAAGARPAP